MTLEEAIKRYVGNAEHERTHGNLQGCMEFKQLAEWMKELKELRKQRPKGHWIEQIDHEENCRTLICSNCDRPALHDGDSIWKHKFCPHCGAKMINVPDINDGKFSEIPTGLESEEW